MITMEDVDKAIVIVSEEYDKLIAGYIKMKAQDVMGGDGKLATSGADYWMAGEKWRTDADVKYLFESNGNISRDAPQIGNSWDRFPISDITDPVWKYYEHDVHPDFSLAGLQGLVPSGNVDANGLAEGFVQGELVKIGEGHWEWQAL